MCNKEYKDVKGAKLYIGDILFNPYANDYWLVSGKYNVETDEDDLYIKLVHYDFDEDICVAKNFLKVGSIYEFPLVEEDKKASEIKIRKVGINDKKSYRQ